LAQEILQSITNNIISQGRWRRFYRAYPRSSYFYYNWWISQFKLACASFFSVYWWLHL